MGVPKKDRFNDNWYGIRKREWYGVILRLTPGFARRDFHAQSSIALPDEAILGI